MLATSRAVSRSQPASTGSRRSKRERARPAEVAHSLDVCNTENPTRNTTHDGARMKAPSPTCRKRPFAIHAARRLVLDEFLERNQDRALFDLPPRPKDA